MSSAATEPVDRLPDGIRNAFLFQVCNTGSFTLVQGAPMLLYFKRLDASAAVLGVVMALPMLLNLLQIPAAAFVEKYGYRTFVLRGWTLRTLFIIFMAGVVVLPSGVDRTTRLCLMLFLLFVYYMMRGISSCGFLPWMTQLVSEGARGRYISIDQICIQAATVVTLLFGSFYLRAFDGDGSFALLFLVSFGIGMLSLHYLKRIPDVPVPESSRSREPVPWSAIIRYKPFQRLVVYDLVVLTAYAAGGLLILPMCRDKFGLSDASFLMVPVITGTVFIPCLHFFGKLVNATGSRPFLFCSSGIHAFHFLVWGLVAAGLIPFGWPTITFQSVTWSVGAALFNIANTRLAMTTVPALGRSHFFAVFTVSQSIVMGLAPIAFGITVTSLKGWQAFTGPFEWDRFSVLYLVCSAIMLSSFFALRHVAELKAMTTEEFLRELFIATPAKALDRVLHRRRIP
jgi:MFS family permease